MRGVWLKILLNSKKNLGKGQVRVVVGGQQGQKCHPFTIFPPISYIQPFASHILHPTFCLPLLLPHFCLPYFASHLLPPTFCLPLQPSSNKCFHLCHVWFFLKWNDIIMIKIAPPLYTLSNFLVCCCHRQHLLCISICFSWVWRIRNKSKNQSDYKTSRLVSMFPRKTTPWDLGVRSDNIRDKLSNVEFCWVL